MYGNVGSARRLDFTVMGPTINEVFRLETLCKALSVHFVMSASVANLLRKEQLQSLGWHKLHGVGRDIEVFSLPALG
jgi:adenylate cyclase